MSHSSSYQVSYDIGCMRSLKKIPDAVSNKFLDMMMRFMANPTTKGLNFESVEGAADRNIKSVRVDQKYRAIAYVHDQDVLFLHVNDHDKAYRWATGRRVKIDSANNRIRIIEAAPETFELPRPTGQVSEDLEIPGGTSLFDDVSDEILLSVGVTENELPLVRKVVDQHQLEASEAHFDATSFDALIALAAGYEPEVIRELLAIDSETSGEDVDDETSFSEVIHSPESRQRVFIPDSEEELRRVFDGDLQHWRVFLHPQQRKLAYRDYNGPAMVRGGAGTGKTVVAMHRARYLADQLANSNSKGRVLFTTFTTSLADDIKANLKTLCPEHLAGTRPRIEVINLDRWVRQFLQSKNVHREIAYLGGDKERLEAVWGQVLDEHPTPEGLSLDFVRAEWEQVIQAQGIFTEKEYMKASRKGRGTALNRNKRKDLWKIFSDYRARMLDEGLMEPDDAYREAVEIIKAEGSSLPYTSVVVDEAQDMGEQAFRLIRAIIPEDVSEDRNSLFIVGDAHQRIYNRRSSMKTCGINILGRSRRLKLNYRTSDEIRAWAVSILEGVSVDDLDEGVDSLEGYVSVFRGPEPDLCQCASEKEELELLVDWLEEMAAGEKAIPKKDIGILAWSSPQLNRIEHYLHDQGVMTIRLKPGAADDRLKEGVRLCTMHRAKGLEFRAVAICFMSASSFPPPKILSSAVDQVDRENINLQFKSLLHVAATRAKSNLRVSWSGEPSGLIKPAISL